VIGDYSGSGVSSAVRAVIARVAAYKIGAYGNVPSGRTVLTSSGSDRFAPGQRVTLNRISGHRDTGRTECPGNALYAQLPAIRALASEPPKGLRFLRMTGAEKVGSFYYTRGPVNPLWTLRTASSAIDHFDVLVDGEVRESVTGGSRTAALRLAPGRHTVTVRRGSLQSSVPVRLGYAVTDAYGVRAVALTSPSATDLGTLPQTWPGFAAPGVATTWTVRALDWAGNTTSASVTRTPVVMTEAEAAPSGSWRALNDPAYLGGRAVLSTTAGSRLTWTFDGPSAQLAVARTPTSGRLHVYLDGEDAGFVDLQSPSVDFRYAVIAPSWTGNGPHTLAVTAEGTAGRPSVIVDGLVRLD